MVQGFLFDLDGTLIDSMPHHHDAWVAWHARRGLSLDADAFFAATAGRANDEILAEMFPAATPAERVAMADEKETLYREIAAQHLKLIEGAQGFVERALAQGLLLAVCTASTPENMALAFARFPIRDWVETVVSPADGLRGKPHPDIFLEAARRLGLAPAQCLVFEDAPLGIEAAHRAGMGAVALTTTLPDSAFAGYPNLLASAPDFRALDALSLTKEDHHA
ncbi:MAG: HAD family phosphatase [Proteobacteria bacterium]|nr:HAD family phosphatase [Pseudomonadota bacterium]